MKLATYCFEPARSQGKSDVVLIHGTGANASLWRPQIDALVELGHRCIVPELRGHGSSSEPAEPTDVNVHIADLLETLDANNVRYPSIFIGHSLGAIISLTLAERQPELFERILAVGLPGRILAPVTFIFKTFLRTAFIPVKSRNLHHKFSRRHRILVETELHSLQEIVGNFSSLNFVKNLPKISCPVHFSVGRLDVVAPWFYVRDMHRMLPGSTFKVFEWAGHSCMDDQPAQFHDWLLANIEAN